jgi:hypothetical protein
MWKVKGTRGERRKEGNKAEERGLNKSKLKEWSKKSDVYYKELRSHNPEIQACGMAMFINDTS